MKETSVPVGKVFDKANFIIFALTRSMKSVFAIFLALLMLITNVQIALATHYCDGEAVKTSISVGHEDIDCGMEGSCEEESDSPTIKSKNCCENKFTELSIEDDYQKSVQVKTAVDFQFIVAFVSTTFIISSLHPSVEAGYLNYSPPLLDLDIPVLIQSFLI